MFNHGMVWPPVSPARITYQVPALLVLQVETQAFASIVCWQADLFCGEGIIGSELLHVQHTTFVHILLVWERVHGTRLY